MKLICSMLVAGVGIWGMTGCVAPVKHSTAQSMAQRAATDAEDDPSAVPEGEDAAEHVSFPAGNPDAYAHFAAGMSYKLNEDEDDALQQFDDAALDDPAHEPLVIELAQVYLHNKDYIKAAELLAKSARRPDASAAIFACLARAQLALGHSNEALAASKQAIARAPGALDGYDCRAQVYFHTQQWPEAARTLRRASRQIEPRSGMLVALVDLYLAYLKDQPKDTQARAEAISLLTRAAGSKIDSTFLWQRMADAYSELGLPAKSAEIYNRLLAEYPDSPETRDAVDAIHEKLAGLYFQTEDRTNATKQLQALVRDNPTRYPRAWFFLGEISFLTGDFPPAIDDFQNALRGDPTIEQAYYDLSLAQLDTHQKDAAFATLKQAQERFPQTFLCEFYTGVVDSHVKNFNEAIRHFKEAEIIARATDKSKLDERFYFQFGAACERAREYKQAEDYLQKCVDLQPDFAEALNYLGYMLADLGQELPRARGLIEKALKLEPNNGAYLDSLGWVLFKLHQPDEALPCLLKAQRLSPEPDATVLDHIGEVYLALHQTDKAVEAWKKSYSIEANDDVKHKLDAYAGGS